MSTRSFKASLINVAPRICDAPRGTVVLKSLTSRQTRILVKFGVISP